MMMIILSRFNLRQFCRDRRLAVLRSLPPFFSPLIRFDQKGYWWAVHHSYISPPSSFLHRPGHFNISICGTRRLASFVKILNQEDISKHQNHDTIQEVNTDVRIRNPRNTTKQYGGERGSLSEEALVQNNFDQMPPQSKLPLCWLKHIQNLQQLGATHNIWTKI